MFVCNLTLIWLLLLDHFVPLVATCTVFPLPSTPTCHPRSFRFDRGPFVSGDRPQQKRLISFWVPVSYYCSQTRSERFGNRMGSIVVSTPQCGLCVPAFRAGRGRTDFVRDFVSVSQSFFSGRGSGHLAVVGFGLKGDNDAMGWTGERRYDSKLEGPRAAVFPFLQGKKDKEVVKKELLDAIAPLQRGAEASDEDITRVDKIARKLEALNPTKNPLESPFLNGKWELLYTTSSSLLKKEWVKFLRPNGAIYQAINADTLRAQNVETWPYFNYVTANLEPVNSRKVIVKFDVFKIGGLISVKAPGRARGELEVTYLDDELRLSRGDRGNLFVLIMDDPTYRVPV